jgi:hypothetical protein
MALVGSLLLRFWDSMSVPSSGGQQDKKNALVGGCI